MSQETPAGGAGPGRHGTGTGPGRGEGLSFPGGPQFGRGKGGWMLGWEEGLFLVFCGRRSFMPSCLPGLRCRPGQSEAGPHSQRCSSCTRREKRLKSDSSPRVCVISHLVYARHSHATGGQPAFPCAGTAGGSFRGNPRPLRPCRRGHAVAPWRAWNVTRPILRNPQCIPALGSLTAPGDMI